MQGHDKIHKRHTLISLYCGRCVMALGMNGFYYIPDQHNPTDKFKQVLGIF